MTTPNPTKHKAKSPIKPAWPNKICPMQTTYRHIVLCKGLRCMWFVPVQCQNCPPGQYGYCYPISLGVFLEHKITALEQKIVTALEKKITAPLKQIAAELTTKKMRELMEIFVNAKKKYPETP